MLVDHSYGPVDINKVIPVVELRTKQWGTKPRRRKRRDFDAVYYMRVHNCSGASFLLF